MYLFSKLGLSLLLLLCLIGVLYIFYINYQKQSNIASNKDNIETELKINIKKNSKTIENISEEIKLTQNSLNKIIESISNQNKKNELSEINKNIKLLSDAINMLSNEIEIIKKNKTTENFEKNKNNLDITENSIQDIKNLILIKYENNLNFDDELNYLRKISKNNNNAAFEKIFMLSRKPFKGNSYLEKIIDNEVSAYLKNTVNKNNNLIFNKIILPYINISPSSENKINDDIILKIIRVKTNIGNKNLESAKKNIEDINSLESVFITSVIEIDKYLDFKNELKRIR